MSSGEEVALGQQKRKDLSPALCALGQFSSPCIVWAPQSPPGAPSGVPGESWPRRASQEHTLGTTPPPHHVVGGREKDWEVKCSLSMSTPNRCEQGGHVSPWETGRDEEDPELSRVLFRSLSSSFSPMEPVRT